ncbi:MAG: hypothetical protein J2O48_10015 [Solirubrobacterales bacterium]|nr:hypothetical protein [Solirubrobacterales bacterium]
MRLRRKNREPVLSPEDGALLADIYFHVRANLWACRALSEKRSVDPPGAHGPEALKRAAAIAKVLLRSYIEIQDPQASLLDRVPERESPAGAIIVLRVLSYGFAAQAEREVVSLAVPSAEELDGLIDKFGAREWVSRLDRPDASGVPDSAYVPDLNVDPEPELTRVDAPGGITPFRAFLLKKGLPYTPETALAARKEYGEEMAEAAETLMQLVANVITLLFAHQRTYQRLYAAVLDGTPTDETTSQALKAAVDIAIVVQPAWRRLDLIAGSIDIFDDDLIRTIDTLEVLYMNLVLLADRPDQVPVKDAAVLESDLVDKIIDDPKIERLKARIVGSEPHEQEEFWATIEQLYEVAQQPAE